MDKGYKAIGDYGIIGNRKTAALVGIDGSIDWCCLPHFDSPSVFGALLDQNKGGRFKISLPDGEPVRQTYIPKTNILKTIISSDTGVISVQDFMPCFREQADMKTYSEIHRWVRGLGGKPEVIMEFDPKFNFGRDPTKLNISKYGAHAHNDTHSLSLSTDFEDFELEKRNGKIIGKHNLSYGEETWIVCALNEERPKPPKEYSPLMKLNKTRRYWRALFSRCSYKGPWSDMVHRSALLLNLLTFHPTGAIVAAPTTSLPEYIGGSRNWDYRYSWLRDTLLAAQSLHTVNSYVGKKYEELLHLSLTELGNLPTLTTVTGGTIPDEEEIEHWEGYKETSPVRIGNRAKNQNQWGVYGDVIEGILFLHRKAGGIGKELYHELVEPIVDRVSLIWNRPDYGIWEMQEKHHYLTSKMWCWVAVDRGIKIAKRLGYWDDIAAWEPYLEEIKEDVLSKGWSSEKQSFKMAYDIDALDASVLLMPLKGFLSAKHPKMEKTINKIMEELGDDGLLYRYNPEEVPSDTIDCKDSKFLLCTCWLIRCLIRQNRIKKAKDIFERLLSLGNHLHLFSEEVDPKNHRLLGNFPQAYTHLGLINVAIELGRSQTNSHNLLSS